jgi:formate hydrogenlyase subunit 4
MVAFLLGLASAGLFIYTGAILPLVLLHAVEDFLSFVTMGNVREISTPTISEVLMTLGLFVPFAIYGVWLLRHKRTGIGNILIIDKRGSL